MKREFILLFAVLLAVTLVGIEIHKRSDFGLTISGFAQGVAEGLGLKSAGLKPEASKAPTIVTDSDRAEYALKARMAAGQQPPVEIPSDSSSKATSSAPSEGREFFSVTAKDEFRVGSRSYKFEKANFSDWVGDRDTEYRNASHGSILLVMWYLVRNDGTEKQSHPAEFYSDDLGLLIDGQHYPMDANATRVAAKFFAQRVLTLPPGIYKENVAVFQIPKAVHERENNFKIELLVSDKDSPRTAVLPLYLHHHQQSGASRRRPRQSAATSRHQSWGPGNSAYEEMRREMLLNRPPGTSSTDYDPDWH